MTNHQSITNQESTIINESKINNHESQMD